MATGQIPGLATIPAGVLGDKHFSNQTGDILAVDKHAPLIQGKTSFGSKVGDTPATAEYPVHVTGPNGGTVRGFHAMLEASGASTNITYDLLKNGVSILSALPTFNSSGTRMVKDGTLSSSTLVSGDVLSILQTVTTPTGALGPMAWVNVSEPQAPS